MYQFFLSQIDKEQAELARANFSTLRKEAQSILDLVSSLLLSSFEEYQHFPTKLCVFFPIVGIKRRSQRCVFLKGYRLTVVI